MIYVIDDDGAVRASLDSLLRSVGYSVETFSNVAEYRVARHAGPPSCLVLDVRLPGLSGLDFQHQLAAADDPTPVVLMTGHADVPMSVRGMKAGAVDFLQKPFREQDMLDAVAAALERDKAQRAAGLRSEQLRRRLDTLTPRERQVMDAVVIGRLNKQIAFDLGLSEITVKLHRGSAMRKMNARTLAELVTMAGALGLVS
jgi:FixJ family two-component response regulator